MTTTATDSPKAQTPQDFHSGLIVRWCPGCGDYAILAAVQKVLAERGKAPHEYTFVSGIGCSSRFPLYMSTYGFHSIHGRALAVATGVKAANPKQEVWVITGDGDCLSIGGNHFIHALRRNQDFKILLFNNEIYGLTKGQYSPTSRFGMVNKSAPYGTIDEPVSPIKLALAAGATFVARTADNDMAHMAETFRRAAEHKGSAFIEILQNCVIFNDKVFEEYYGVKTRKDTLVYLHHGQPVLYGKTVEKGLAVDGFNFKSVDASQKDQVYVHDEHEPTGTVANMLAGLSHPESPVPLGVFRCVERPAYHEMMYAQVESARKANGEPDLGKLLKGPKTWTVS
ncbi:MAG TPA: 2-oxoacid:ferredoxin oxidoreductase subunit beta [bacterium]|nr:2-oxoacid:ferredoxin oxidoreductase subunit beta [bacterium]